MDADLTNSSNLTFSLAPGWAFVTTEGWRKDLSAAWAGVSPPPINANSGEEENHGYVPGRTEEGADGT